MFESTTNSNLSFSNVLIVNPPMRKVVDLKDGQGARMVAKRAAEIIVKSGHKAEAKDGVVMSNGPPTEIANILKSSFKDAKFDDKVMVDTVEIAEDEQFYRDETSEPRHAYENPPPEDSEYWEREAWDEVELGSNALIRHLTDGTVHWCVWRDSMATFAEGIAESDTEAQRLVNEALNDMENDETPSDNPTGAKKMEMIENGGRHYTEEEANRIYASAEFKNWWATRRRQGGTYPGHSLLHAFMTDVGKSAETHKKWTGPTWETDKRGVDTPAHKKHLLQIAAGRRRNIAPLVAAAAAPMVGQAVGALAPAVGQVASAGAPVAQEALGQVGQVAQSQAGQSVLGSVAPGVGQVASGVGAAYGGVGSAVGDIAGAAGSVGKTYSSALGVPQKAAGVAGDVVGAAGKRLTGWIGGNPCHNPKPESMTSHPRTSELVSCKSTASAKASLHTLDTMWESGAERGALKWAVDGIASTRLKNMMTRKRNPLKPDTIAEKLEIATMYREWSEEHPIPAQNPGEEKGKDAWAWLDNPPDDTPETPAPEVAVVNPPEHRHTDLVEVGKASVNPGGELVTVYRCSCGKTFVRRK